MSDHDKSWAEDVWPSAYDTKRERPSVKPGFRVGSTATSDGLGLPTDRKPTRSCSGCKFLLIGENEIDHLMGTSSPRTFSSPLSSANLFDDATLVCSAKSQVLARWTSRRPDSVDPTLKGIAESCSSYEEQDGSLRVIPERSQPGAYSTTLSIAIPGLPSEARQRRTKAHICSSCDFYIPGDGGISRGGISRGAWGWDLPACSILGKLLPSGPGAQGIIAKRCDAGTVTDATKSIADLVAELENRMFVEFRPDYAPKILGATGPSKITPPEQLPRLKTLRPRWKDAGIVAVRDVPDPTGRGPLLKVPVFDLTQEHLSTSPDILARVPKTGDAESPENYIDHAGLVYQTLVSWFKLKMSPAMIGSAGTGKTELFRHIAWMLGLPFMRISITATSEVDDIIGKMMYSPEKGTYFHHGRLVQAWSQKGITVVDEPNLGPPALWHALRPLTDNSKQLVLDVADGQVIRSDEYSFLGFAMNPSWDYRNSGANDLADADGSRLIHIDCPYPPDDIERTIIMDNLRLTPAAGKEGVIADYVVTVGKAVRDATKTGSLPCSWGVRQSIKAAQLLCYFPPEQAYAMALGNSLDPTAAGILKGIVLSKTPQGSR